VLVLNCQFTNYQLQNFFMLPLLTGLGALAAATYAGYASMSPGSQLYGQTLTHGGDPRQIALTYDDGPNDPYTLELLDLLAKHGAKATFFLIGKYVRHRPDIVRAIHQAGHAIGNHTYSHPNLIFVSSDRLNQELKNCHKALEDTIGSYDPLFRPPFGGRRPAVLRTARAQGLVPVMWSVTAYDWSAKSTEMIVAKVSDMVDSRKNKQGEIILLHDGGHLSFATDRRYTVEATRHLLEKYSVEGRRFVSIPELTRVQPTTS
jgi:peptidoglycan/xylan/chitin deacetylase (PgdA/CDA1 family)